MSLAFASQLGLRIWKTNVEAQNVDCTILETYKVVVSTFFLSDKDNWERFFEKSFLLVNVKPDTRLKMPFITMSNVNIDFQTRNLQWRFYTTKQVKLIEKKEFAVAVFDLEHETFVVYITTLSVDLRDQMHLSKKAQIAHLKADEAPIEMLSKYADFADVFSLKLATKLLKHKISNYAIKLIDHQ